MFSNRAARVDDPQVDLHERSNELNNHRHGVHSCDMAKHRFLLPWVRIGGRVYDITYDCLCSHRLTNGKAISLLFTVHMQEYSNTHCIAKQNSFKTLVTHFQDAHFQDAFQDGSPRYLVSWKSVLKGILKSVLKICILKGRFSRYTFKIPFKT